MSKILQIGKYSVWMIPHNYVVGTETLDQDSAIDAGEKIIANEVSYHPELQQALKNVYKRLVRDTIKNKNKVLIISELKDVLIEMDKIMKSIEERV